MINVDEGVTLRQQASFPRAAVERSEKDWAQIRDVILDALEPFPGAREAVVQALIQNFREGKELIDGDGG